MAKEDPAEKRLAAIENSLRALGRVQQSQEKQLWRSGIRQKNLKNGMHHLARRQKMDKDWISYLRAMNEEDSGRLEELALVISKMIDPIHKMNVTLSQLQMKIHQLRQQQSELARQMPNPTKPLAAKEPVNKSTQDSPAPPVDKKKRRKVLESVAFLSPQVPTHA